MKVTVYTIFYIRKEPQPNIKPRIIMINLFETLVYLLFKHIISHSFLLQWKNHDHDTFYNTRIITCNYVINEILVETIVIKSNEIAWNCLKLDNTQWLLVISQAPLYPNNLFLCHHVIFLYSFPHTDVQNLVKKTPKTRAKTLVFTEEWIS